MPESAVFADAVDFRVRSATLLSDVSLEFQAGELVAVIGPNGAGKSTLLGLLSGNLPPTAGRVFVNGIDTSKALPAELALERSILTQTVPFDVPYTVAQVVEMGRFPYRHDETNTHDHDTRSIAQAMEQTDTTRFAHRLFATLSKGEQTRVSLARVIAQATPIVLLDEPTTALDVAHQERIMRRTLELSRQGKTTIVVLHDLNSAAGYADRIVLMDRGRVVADGEPRDVLDADLLSSVYDQPLVVVDHPLKDRPLVLPT